MCIVVLVAQSFPTLCDFVDCCPPGSSVHGILQTRILQGLLCPSPGHLPDPGIKPGSPALQAASLLSESLGKHKTLTYVLSRSVVSDSLQPWTIVHQAPLSMGIL